ncbi:hypothetical protein [Bartonella sp. B30(2025)]
MFLTFHLFFSQLIFYRAFSLFDNIITTPVYESLRVCVSCLSYITKKLSEDIIFDNDKRIICKIQCNGQKYNFTTDKLGEIVSAIVGDKVAVGWVNGVMIDNNEVK